MTFRVLAVGFGILAGLAWLALLRFGWGEIAALWPTQAPDAFTALSIPANRLAGAVAGSIAAFAVTAQSIALAGGILETRATLRRIAASPSDWRSASGNMTVALSAVAMLAGPSGSVDFRALPVAEAFWLDRMTLRRLIGPLPVLVFAAGAAIGLLSDIAGTGWRMALLAGLCGWLVISAAHYLACVALSPIVSRALAAIALTIRPVASAPMAGNRLTAVEAADPPSIAGDLADLLAEPIERLADAADRLGSAMPPRSRDDAVESALMEIRAGIERLLAQSSDRRS